MADITDQHDQTSPTELDDHTGNGTAGESRGVKRQRPSAADDDDDDDEKAGRERRKIEIKFIADKSRRHITFSKRKAGIMKKVRTPYSTTQHGNKEMKRRKYPNPPPPMPAGGTRQSKAAKRDACGWETILMSIRKTGVRIVRPYWYTSATARGVGDGTGLHFHNAQAPTVGHQS